MEYGGIYVLIVAGAYPATGVEFRAGGLVASEKKEVEAQRSRARFTGIVLGYEYMVPVSLPLLYA